MSQNRQTIAVDIDDVLAANAEGFVSYSNRKWGTKLTTDDYDEHWEKLWEVDASETNRRSLELHNEGILKTYQHNTDAKPVLEHLRKRYKLIIITSRRKEGQQDTVEWIELYFKGIFSDIHFAGFWDTFTERSILGTKAELCKEIGADYLIDDQLKHCIAAAQAGLNGVLFGDYPWNRQEELPDKVTRCKSWVEVQEYFDALT